MGTSWFGPGGPMRCRATRGGRRGRSRRGVAALEMALVLLVFLTLIFGMLDLGLAVFRYHVLAQTARQTARQAIVHGSLAEKLGPWGPENYSATADAEHAIAAVARASLTGFDPSEVTVSVEWLQGTNERNYPVRVVVAGSHQPMTLFLFGQTLSLQAESTMIIAH